MKREGSRPSFVSSPKHRTDVVDTSRTWNHSQKQNCELQIGTISSIFAKEVRQLHRLASQLQTALEFHIFKRQRFPGAHSKWQCFQLGSGAG